MIDAKSLDTLLRSARTHNVFQDKPVSEDQLRQIHAIMKCGPDLAELAAGARGVREDEGGQGEAPARAQPGQHRQDHGCAGDGDHRLRFALLRAPAADLPAQSGGARTTTPARARKRYTLRTAFRNSTLQGAYLIIAVRAVGLDVGAMSGFNNAMVDQAFFPDGRFKSNFLCNIGYGDHAKLFNQNPRLDFDDVCSFA